MSADPSALARRARELVESGREGLLSSLSVDLGGWPFGSWVPYCLDEEGCPAILISSLAEHRKNLEADPRASLLVVDPSGAAAPARATLLARFTIVPDDDRAPLAARYLARVPDAQRIVAMRDFAFFRGAIERVRFIAGFGEIGWIDPAAWRSAIDPVS